MRWRWMGLGSVIGGGGRMVRELGGGADSDDIEATMPNTPPSMHFLRPSYTK